MTFVNGQRYTRREIKSALGGNAQQYLPMQGSRVVYGALTDDLNPLAPREILVGDGPVIRKAAEVLAAQEEPIPIFIKRGTDRWLYVGVYRCARYVTDPEIVAAKAAAAGRSDVTAILYMDLLPNA